MEIYDLKINGIREPLGFELSDRYLASEIDSLMDVNTLTTKAFYVQDQY